MSTTHLEQRVRELLHAVADAMPVAERPAPDSDIGRAKGVVDVSLQPARDRSRARTRARGAVRVLAGVAAASVVIAGGLAVIGHRGQSSPLGAPPSVPAGASAFDLSLAGWKLTGHDAQQTTSDDGVRVLFVIDDPARGVDGPVIRVGATAPPNGYGAGDSARSIVLKGRTAMVASDDSVVRVVWPARNGRTVFIEGLRTTEGDVLAIANGLTLDAAGVPTAASVVPAGLEATTLDAPAPSATIREYEFVRGHQSLKVDLYPGGRSMYEVRIGGDLRHSVDTLGTRGALLDYGGGRYRVDVFDGTYTWEIDGEPFASAQAFLQIVDSLRAAG